MANDLAAIVPKIWGATLPSLRIVCNALRTCRVDFDPQVAKQGDTISMVVPPTSGVTDVVPGTTPAANTDKKAETRDIKLSNWKRSDKIAFTGKEVREYESGNFRNMAIVEQTIALAEHVNSVVTVGMKNASYRRVGTAGTNPYATSDVDSINVRAALNTAKAPQNDRFLLLGPKAEAAALGIQSIKEASLRGSADTKNTGELGTIFGITHLGDQSLPTHTAGTATGALTTGTTVPTVGSYTLYLKAATAGTIKLGDLIEVTTAGKKYQYVATADVATVDATASGIAVTVSPAVQVAHAAGDTWALTASHSCNLAMQRGAYGLAIRPLNPEDLGAGQHQQMTDSETGLSVMYSLIPEYMQNSLQVSILYGHGPCRHEWLVRLLGDAANP